MAFQMLSEPCLTRKFSAENKREAAAALCCKLNKPDQNYVRKRDQCREPRNRNGFLWP